jgi:hypothetical protein
MVAGLDQTAGTTDRPLNSFPRLSCFAELGLELAFVDADRAASVAALLNG